MRLMTGLFGYASRLVFLQTWLDMHDGMMSNANDGSEVQQAELLSLSFYPTDSTWLLSLLLEVCEDGSFVIIYPPGQSINLNLNTNLSNQKPGIGIAAERYVVNCAGG